MDIIYNYYPQDCIESDMVLALSIRGLDVLSYVDNKYMTDENMYKCSSREYECQGLCKIESWCDLYCILNELSIYEFEDDRKRYIKFLCENITITKELYENII